MKTTLTAILFLSIIFNLQGQTNNVVFAFEFTDASVPPPYHRSYTIKVTSNEVSLEIYDYSSTLLSEVYSIDETQFKEFQTKLKACKIKLKAANKETHGCTGGTGDSFSLPFAGTKKVEGEVYHCGGKDYGDLKGNLAEGKDLFKSMVPDFSSKMESTRKVD